MACAAQERARHFEDEAKLRHQLVRQAWERHELQAFLQAQVDKNCYLAHVEADATGALVQRLQPFTAERMQALMLAAEAGVPIPPWGTVSGVPSLEMQRGDASDCSLCGCRLGTRPTVDTMRASSADQNPGLDLAAVEARPNRTVLLSTDRSSFIWPRHKSTSLTGYFPIR